MPTIIPNTGSNIKFMTNIKSGIRLAVVNEGEKKAYIVVEEMAAEQAHIFSILQFDRFVPK